MIMNDQLSGNVYKEKRQFICFFYNFKQMFLKPSFKGPFGLSNILHPQPFNFQLAFLYR